MSEVIVLIEHSEGKAKPASLKAVTAARQLGEEVSLVVVGYQLEEIVASLKTLHVGTILVADHPVLAHNLADKYASVLVSVMERRGAQSLVAASSSLSKDILPRVAALLDAPMVSEVVSIHRVEQAWEFGRPMQAGRMRGTIALEDGRFVMTILPSAFQLISLAESSSQASVEEIFIDPDALPNGMDFISRQVKKSTRPELVEARVVVAGGRPLKDSETFEKLIGGLADALHGATGCTRAAVDCGIASNDCQVGQTGKVIAPELYVGVGVSGAVQHLAGMKDSKVIVAVNKDPEAPIFKIANYGLVGDLHEIVPEMIRGLSRSERENVTN